MPLHIIACSSKNSAKIAAVVGGPAGIAPYAMPKAVSICVRVISPTQGFKLVLFV